MTHSHNRSAIHAHVSRRGVLLGGISGVLAAGVFPCSGRATERVNGNVPRRVLRFAHPTDIHVQPERRGGEGMAACFRHMMNLPDAPQMIITGGDLPMDSASTPEATVKVQWDLFQKVLGDHVPRDLPLHHTIGNHDIFGRDKKKSGATGQEKGFGRRWFLDNFGYERTFRSFESAGWKFIILDSISLLPGGRDFVGRIEGAQLEWFTHELATTPAATPIVVVTHVPIVSVANFFDHDDVQWKSDGPTLEIKSSRMHVDCRELDVLLRSHPNVKLCLSGHLHLFSRCEYNGLTHICDGAVCGAKWDGPKRQTPEGYGLIDLFDDGTFQHQYVSYGWKAERPG